MFTMYDAETFLALRHILAHADSRAVTAVADLCSAITSRADAGASQFAQDAQQLLDAIDAEYPYYCDDCQRRMHRDVMHPCVCERTTTAELHALLEKLEDTAEQLGLGLSVQANLLLESWASAPIQQHNEAQMRRVIPSLAAFISCFH